MGSSYQTAFIQILKNTVPANLHLAEEISRELNISADSAYRRLRGETDLTLNETVKLCMHFNIPLEALNAEMEDVVSFRVNNILGNPDNFTSYLESLARDLAWLQRFDDGMLYYAAEDVPVFYHFYFPRLARFKMIYWTKSILNAPAYQGAKVEDLQLPEGWEQKIEAITKQYQQISTTEIWNEDTIKSTLQQIRFYWDAGFFREEQTLLDVIGDLEQLIAMAAKQAEVGKKYNPVKGTFTDTEFSMYISDLMIGNNHVYLESGERNSSYIGYGSFNYMRTGNASFNRQIQQWLGNLIGKSTLVSKVAEKQRNQFFKQAAKRLTQLKDELIVP